MVAGDMACNARINVRKINVSRFDCWLSNSSCYGSLSWHTAVQCMGRIGSYQGIFGYLQDPTFHKCQTLSAVSKRNSSKIFLHIWLFQTERELFFTWPQSVWLIARIIYTLNPDRPKGPWTGGFPFWHISKNQDEYLPSRHKPTLNGWLVGAE